MYGIDVKTYFENVSVFTIFKMVWTNLANTQTIVCEYIAYNSNDVWKAHDRWKISD